MLTCALNCNVIHRGFTLNCAVSWWLLLYFSWRRGVVEGLVSPAKQQTALLVAVWLLQSAFHRKGVCLMWPTAFFLFGESRTPYTIREHIISLNLLITQTNNLCLKDVRSDRKDQKWFFSNSITSKGWWPFLSFPFLSYFSLKSV